MLGKNVEILYNERNGDIITISSSGVRERMRNAGYSIRFDRPYKISNIITDDKKNFIMFKTSDGRNFNSKHRANADITNKLIGLYNCK